MSLIYYIVALLALAASDFLLSRVSSLKVNFVLSSNAVILSRQGRGHLGTCSSDIILW